MRSNYSNEFLNQYSNGNMPNGLALGGGVGAAGGAGLGALFAALAGANPALGLLGAIPGALVGAPVGNAIARRNNQRVRTDAYGQLTPEEQQMLLATFASDLDNTVPNADGSFSAWNARDPQGLERFMLQNL